MKPCFLGIDIGTQGARVALVGADGTVLGSAGRVFGLNERSREEQSPEAWWDACVASIRALMGQGVAAGPIRAVAVTSTSGTVIPVDENHCPLHDALMYSDKRSVLQGQRVTEIALRYHNKGFTAFNSSSGLAKMVWFAENFPEKVARLHRWLHAADYITGRLSGVWGITDYTNAFKSGYDISDYCWPEWICEHLPVRKEWLPGVLPSGAVIGAVRPELAKELGLPLGISVTTGITDGCASQVASGAINPGEWNTTIGTTMVIKGVTRNEVIDPSGRIYSHRHPAGYWMPGGASNTGADWVTGEFGDELGVLNEAAFRLIPTGLAVWPLMQEGERFPFIAAGARGFAPDGLDRALRYTASMEGVAYIERYAYQLIEQLSGETVAAIFTAGGASNSDAWLTIRAAVLNRPIYKMREVSGAMGAAILAASTSFYDSVITAVKEMVKIDKTVLPGLSLVGAYEKGYHDFVTVLREKGYINEESYA
ncbi:FGGY-family carbohydrate kinase [Puia sp. P3]|uniref:FGGY-family carbohydrate kinase n=1 Tax=Puia sp. P3 TaxID=3423952 RepID=UPI003D66D531